MRNWFSTIWYCDKVCWNIDWTNIVSTNIYYFQCSSWWLISFAWICCLNQGTQSLFCFCQSQVPLLYRCLKSVMYLFIHDAPFFAPPLAFIFSIGNTPSHVKQIVFYVSCLHLYYVFGLRVLLFYQEDWCLEGMEGRITNDNKEGCKY